jgi:hypothetical protein
LDTTLQLSIFKSLFWCCPPISLWIFLLQNIEFWLSHTGIMKPCVFPTTFEVCFLVPCKVCGERWMHGNLPSEHDMCIWGLCVLSLLNESCYVKQVIAKPKQSLICC